MASMRKMAIAFCFILLSILFLRKFYYSAPSITFMMDSDGFTLTNGIKYPNKLKPCQEFHPRCWFVPDFSDLYHPPINHVRFYEETTASRFYPVSIQSPDFTWALAYTSHRALVYKDYGSGCVMRIHVNRINTQAIAYGAQLNLDGILINVNFYPPSAVNGTVYPYLYPISRNKGNGFEDSGYILQFPFCYSRSVEVYITQTHPLFENFTKSVDFLFNCGFGSNHGSCGKYQPLYATVTSLRIPIGRKLINAFSIDSYSKLEKPYRDFATYLNSHKLFTNATCLPNIIKGKGTHVLYEAKETSGVISYIQIELNDENDIFWLDTLISVIVDGDSTFIDHVSLNGLFGISTVSQTFASMFNGIARSPCHQNRFRGIFRMPIPFTHSVKVVLYLNVRTKIFYDISVEQKVHGNDIMYLKIAQSTFRLQPIENSKLFLNISNLSGRYMGMTLSIWNADKKHTELDIDIWKDGLKLPVSYGTGLEDHFGYNGGCSGVRNQLPFQGCAHRNDGEHNSDFNVRFYRYHMFDPIIFHHSLEIAMEGEKQNIRLEAKLNPEDLLEIDEWRKLYASATLFLYIENSGSKMSLVDSFEVGEETSRTHHAFTSKQTLECISLSGMQYTGSKHQNLVVNARVCEILEPFNFKFTAKSGSDILIRRHYNCVPFKWNEEALVKLNNNDVGPWFFPKGSLNFSHSLCDFEFAIDRSFVKDSNTLHVQPLTEWRDYKYEVFSIL